MVETGRMQKVPLNARITREAYKLLNDFAASLVKPGQQKPTGKVLTAMILDCEERGNWKTLKEIINGQRDRKIQARRERDRARKARTQNRTSEPRRGRQPKARESKPVTGDVRTSPTSKLKELQTLAKTLSLTIPEQMNISERDDVAQIERIIRRAAKTSVEPNSQYARRLALRNGIVFEGLLEDCFGYYEDNNYYCDRCPKQPECAEKVKAADAAIGVSPNPADLGIVEKRS
jgi:hypothetical protein